MTLSYTDPQCCQANTDAKLGQLQRPLLTSAHGLILLPLCLLVSHSHGVGTGFLSVFGCSLANHRTGSENSGLNTGPLGCNRQLHLCSCAVRFLICCGLRSNTIIPRV